MKKHITKLYLHYLENGNKEAIVELFALDAKVISPLYGVKNADDFYTVLFNDTTKSTIKFINYFESSEDNTIALHFEYTWTLANDKVTVFEVIDIISFDDNFKIKELKIIYDTYQTREVFLTQIKDSIKF